MCPRNRVNSNQFDIVIYKRNYPKLDFGGGVSGFLAESVVATIEVKSTLDKAGIEQAVRAARAAKSLQKNEVKSFSSGYIPPSILSFVVAYDGPAKMETAHVWVKEACFFFPLWIVAMGPYFRSAGSQYPVQSECPRIAG